MTIKLFREYLNLCERLEILPTWKGANQFKELFTNGKGTW